MVQKAFCFLKGIPHLESHANILIQINFLSTFHTMFFPTHNTSAATNFHKNDLTHDATIHNATMTKIIQKKIHTILRYEVTSTATGIMFNFIQIDNSCCVKIHLYAFVYIYYKNVVVPTVLLRLH